MNYEIRITHDEGNCPQLPASPNNDLVYTEGGPHMLGCPHHFAFQQRCSIEIVRDRIQRLQHVPQINSIRLYANGNAKHQDWWTRTTWGKWEQEG